MAVSAKEAAAAVELLGHTTLGDYLLARHSEPHAIGMHPKKEVRRARAPRAAATTRNTQRASAAPRQRRAWAPCRVSLARWPPRGVPAVS
jgi:hypothetical protein